MLLPGRVHGVVGEEVVAGGLGAEADEALGVLSLGGGQKSANDKVDLWEVGNKCGLG